jgi:hypothetical protein
MTDELIIGITLSVGTVYKLGSSPGKNQKNLNVT